MSRRGLWSEEWYAGYLAKRGGANGSAGQVMPAAGAPELAPKQRRVKAPSRLETELAGHLSVMGLRPESQYKFHPERRWRLDFAFPELLIAVEIDGGIFAAENGDEAGKHARGAGRCKDMEKRNAAAELGWFILNYGPPHVRSGEAALQIERLVIVRRQLIAPSASVSDMPA